ncbi:MAG: GFA family protein [Burkholderiaceae bacterium]|nr:GFA family protein [Burkholderiaceae bacterium]
MKLPIEGGCDCRAVRYRLTRPPLVVNCCHCRWCQRETGASFALNAVIESACLELTAGEPVLVLTPSQSGYGQQIARCPSCHVALWSHYSTAGPATCVVRVGTLDNPDDFPPQAHVFVASRQPWVQLSPDVPQFEAYYELAQIWSAESLARRRAIQPQIDAWQATRQRMAPPAPPR